MFVLAGCADGARERSNSDAPTGSITVFAASSLTGAFTDAGAAFEARYPGTTVTFSFGASSALAAQILEGAPADAFAAADAASIDALAAGSASRGTPVVFAHNRLAIIVERGNPLGIADLADLAREDVIVVLCDERVPCGSYARDALDTAGVRVTPDGYEPRVTGVVAKVALGEADAGIVYVSDVAAAADETDGVAIPDADNVIATYPMVATADGGNVATADAFIEFVAGADGQAILERHGFSAP